MNEEVWLKLLNSILRRLEWDGETWLCFRLASDDDLEKVAVVLLKAYCGLYNVEYPE